MCRKERKVERERTTCDMQEPSARDGFRGIRGCSEALSAMAARLHAKLACQRGQGTTEYAILVGVLVVIAILAITIFRPKLEELWQAIASGIQGL